MSIASRRFPDGFLWGAATAAYQVEGGNVGSDVWLLEHLPSTVFREPSGDACDFYHRYPDDVATVAALGLNAFRFGLEWARVEPERGRSQRRRSIITRAWSTAASSTV